MTHGNTVKLLAVTLAAGLVPLSGAQAKYANQEVSYVKGAARPEPVTTEQIQSPRDAASGQANTANTTITDIVISSATTQSNPPRQANMGDTATQEKGVRNTVGPEGPSGVSEANALWQLIDAAKQDGPTGIQSPRDVASGQATGSARQAQGNELPDILNSSSAAPKPDVQNAQTSGFTSAEGRSMSLERTANGQGAPAFFDAPKLDADSGLEFSKTAAGQPVTDNLGDTATHEVGHRTGQSGKFQDDVPSAPNGYLKIEGVDGESVVQSPSSSSTTAGKPRRNRNGTRGKWMHKPVG